MPANPADGVHRDGRWPRRGFRLALGRGMLRGRGQVQAGPCEPSRDDDVPAGGGQLCVQAVIAVVAGGAEPAVSVQGRATLALRSERVQSFQKYFKLVRDREDVSEDMQIRSSLIPHFPP